ncbi:MAG: AAA family ATPase [Chromatiaceae bacterium]|nr:AAA family ATPase [Chromatiaceae bacterium]
MIINSLRAENILKYSTLELENIPQQGLIAVIGDNESGKSSIGESICFALFGRTFSLDDADLDKVIRWGESRCSIKLELTTPNGQGYQVARFLDELGNHGASISRIGEEPMVRGIDEVRTRLKDIIGFGYTEFIESFYLAQREITTPHPHSFAVKAMAGVDALEKVVATCDGELKHTGGKAREAEEQKRDIEEQIQALGLDESHLASLEAEHAQEDAALAEDRQRISSMKDKVERSDQVLDTLKLGAASWLAVPVAASFQQRLQQTRDLEQLVSALNPHCVQEEQTGAAHAQLVPLLAKSRDSMAAFDALRQRAIAYRSWLQCLLGEAEPANEDKAEPTFAARRDALRQRQTQATSSRQISRILMLGFLVSTLVCWGVSGLLGLAPTSPQSQVLAGWLERLDIDTQILLPWIPVAASIMTVMFLVFLVRGIRLGTLLRGLEHAQTLLIDEEEKARKEAMDLSGLDQMPLPAAADLLGRIRDEAIAERVSDYCQGLGAALLDPQKHSARQARFREKVGALEAGMSQVKADAELEIDRRHESVASHSSAIARLDEMIARERERIRRHRKLTAIAESLGKKIEELRRRIRVRELAVDLLHGAIHYISHRFNTEVRNLSANSLPKLTNGRYEHLRIDENLKVKAFSNEKRDFMDLDEISSGTQRQIMLAVRLSLSQKLVNSAIHGSQMLFLDEPFAFFDERRTASALNILPQVSGDFTQIWVTSQTFPAESQFDLYIECDAEETETPVVRRGSRDD